MKNKTSYLLFCLMWFFFTSHSQNVRLSAHLKQVSLGQVFELIQQQSEFIIFYKDNQVDLSRKVNVDADNLSVNQILNQVLHGTGLKYKVFDRQIIIVRDTETDDVGKLLAQRDAEQKKKKVQGEVTDENGNPIYGVSILVKGTHIGVISNLNGLYSLDVPVDATWLVFSIVGMKTKEEKLIDQTNIDVVLVPENFGVDEVVVSALGIKRSEKALTYATQTISADEMTNNRDLSFVNSLSGKVSGMEITKSASGAGGSTKIILRGNKSLSTSSEPLFVIDGIPMANNKGGQLGIFGGSDQGDGLSQINTDDIESITILKGANAAALYGSQGANGVILITTKTGEEGLLKVSFSSSASFESIQKTPDLQFEYGSVGGAKESWSNTKGNYANNYVDEFFETGSTQTNTATISGGTHNTTAYFLFSNTAIHGIVPKNNYQKINLTFKQSTKLLGDHLTVGSNLMLTNGHYSVVGKIAINRVTSYGF